MGAPLILRRAVKEKAICFSAQAVLGVTFQCPLVLWPIRFTDEMEVDHSHENRGSSETILFADSNASVNH